jgi:hypothetical protein
LLAWWAWEILPGPDRWDVRALRATAALLLAAAAVFCAALTVLAVADRGTLVGPAATVLISTAGVAAAVLLAVRAWGAAPTHALRAQYSLLLAYCALLVGPASQVYRQVDRWQDLAGIGSRIAADAAGKPLILLAPDEMFAPRCSTYPVRSRLRPQSCKSKPPPLQRAGSWCNGGARIAACDNGWNAAPSLTAMSCRRNGNPGCGRRNSSRLAFTPCRMDAAMFSCAHTPDQHARDAGGRPRAFMSCCANGIDQAGRLISRNRLIQVAGAARLRYSVSYSIT